MGGLLGYGSTNVACGNRLDNFGVSPDQACGTDGNCKANYDKAVCECLNDECFETLRWGAASAGCGGTLSDCIDMPFFPNDHVCKFISSSDPKLKADFGAL